MSKKVYINIKELIQVRTIPQNPIIGEDMKFIPSISNAYLVMENKSVVDFGIMDTLDLTGFHPDNIEDLSGRYVMPSFCDSHTHAVFASPRDGEFVDKINGLSYHEIAARGGGILNSAKKVEELSENELFDRSMARIQDMIASGTGAIEIKSGYGLNLENELKMLRVIDRIKKKADIPIKSTFLALHALPENYFGMKEAFVDDVVNIWIPSVINEGLADYVDLFCEVNYFDATDINRIAQAIKGTSLKLKAHVNQFNAIGGIERAVKNGAHTVDHLEVMNEEDYLALKESKTMVTLLPLCSFYLGIPYAPIKKLIKEEIPVSLASDFNPGSSPSSNLFFVWSLACIKMKMTPEEALNALTINAAFAMGVETTHGSIFKGYRGKLIVTQPAPSLAYFPYAFGSNHIFKILN